MVRDHKANEFHGMNHSHVPFKKTFFLWATFSNLKKVWPYALVKNMDILLDWFKIDGGILESSQGW